VKLTEIAKRIDAHLKRFEADPVINARPAPNRIQPYYRAYAWVAGRYVAVSYVTFQGHSNLTKEQAAAYLAWLDAGNVGQHYRACREHGPNQDAA
jgi:hypothetical protein